MANTVKLNVVVSDAEMVATVLQQVQRSSLAGEITIAVQPSGSQRGPISQPDSAAGQFRSKVIQGL